jgi:hypothetical protein
LQKGIKKPRKIRIVIIKKRSQKMAMDKSKYPPNWDELSHQLREEVGWKCEWCGAKYGEPHPDTGSIVVLSVAHLNHTPADCERSNLVVLCARCHLRYDARFHAQNARQTRIRKKKQAARDNGQKELWE